MQTMWCTRPILGLLGLISDVLLFILGHWVFLIFSDSAHYLLLFIDCTYITLLREYFARLVYMFLKLVRVALFLGIALTWLRRFAMICHVLFAELVRMVSFYLRHFGRQNCFSQMGTSQIGGKLSEPKYLKFLQ